MIWRFNLLCDSCNWEFLGFALPWKIPLKPTKGSKTKKLQVEIPEKRDLAPASKSEKEPVSIAPDTFTIEAPKSSIVQRREAVSPEDSMLINQANTEPGKVIENQKSSDLRTAEMAKALVNEDEISSEATLNLVEEQIIPDNSKRKKTKTRIKQRRLRES